MFRLPDHWVWDSWVVDDGQQYHLFFLQAPRSLGDPQLRHAAAKIGRATSLDLVNWKYHGIVLEPDPASWDVGALWTGSIVRGQDGLWRMFYTATNTRGHGLRDQCISVAESADLATWRRVQDHPVIQVDSRWYQTLPEDASASETWRDPFVYADSSGGWRMLITARAVGGDEHDDGVLGCARSMDLLHWQLEPPLTFPGAGFGQIEVSQVRIVDGVPLLVFTCHPQNQTPERVSRYGRFCTWWVTAKSVDGPWDIAAARPFTAEPALFAAPLVHRRDKTWALIGFRNFEPEALNTFDIIDPIPVQVRDGALVLRDAPEP